MKNIILTGFMGVGKTTVGKLLAKKLNMKFVDSDEIVEKEFDLSILEIFEKYGEKKFREKEKEVITNLATKDGYIIAVGGGAFTIPEIENICKGLCYTICLSAGFDTIIKRLEQLRRNRPLLKDKSLIEIKELYKVRMACYVGCNLNIETDNLTPNEIVDKILENLRTG